MAPFECVPGESWDTESGAVPTHHNTGADDPEKWCDFHSLLQELYPADNLVAAELAVTRDRVKLEMNGSLTG